jgi:predicted DNA-binding transcriptional regulator AlpA
VELDARFRPEIIDIQRFILWTLAAGSPNCALVIDSHWRFPSMYTSDHGPLAAPNQGRPTTLAHFAVHADPLLTAREAAAYRRQGVSTFWRDVKEGRVPAPVRISPKAPRWRLSELCPPRPSGTGADSLAHTTRGRTPQI